MDVDAFFREQDERMNAPADDEYEYIQRMARLRRPPERHHVSFAFPARNPSLDTLSAGSQQHGPSDVELLSVPHENPSSQLASAPVNVPAANHFIVKEIEMPPVSTTTGHSPASSPILVPTPTDLPVNLKRKESPTKLAKPARKKPLLDARPGSSSPEPVPAPKKLKSLTKLPPPISVKIPEGPAPITDALSSSPIEEPNFSVLVSRFEPPETSTQPQKPPAPELSYYEQMKLQIQWKQQQNPDQKRRTASASKPGAGPGVPAVLPKADDIISVSSSSSSRPTSPHARPAPEPKPITAKRKTKTEAPKPPAPPAKKSGTKGKQKEVKQKEVKLLPPAYAQMLLDKLKENPNDPLIRQESARLEGCTVFYIGDDMTVALTKTKGCMAMIIRLGGTLAPVFDPQTVTHIVCEGALPTAERALKVKNIAEVPDEIPIVRWSWVIKGGQLFEHAAFAKRVPPIEGIAPVKGKGKERAPPPKRSAPAYSEDEDSDAERARHAPPPKKRPSKGQQPPAQVSSSTVDPLAEFHELALANRRAEGLESDSEDEGVKNSSTAVADGNPNQFIIDKLQELSDVHEAKAGEGDGWRVYTYRKVLRAMSNHKEPIETYVDAMKLPFVADKTAQKIMEIVETGDLRRIKYENTPDVRIKKLFQGIYGVGPATAQKFYNSGCRTLADLLAGKGEVVLSEAQKIGIEFYDDINSRMPREEAQALFDIIKPVALKIDPKLEVHIMGSFRRGKSTCGDIDIMITRDPADGKAHNGILHFLLKALHKAGIITEDLALPEDPFDEEAIYRGLCRLPGNPDAKRRRIDFLTVPWKSRGAALMYYTGDDIFNRKMRFKAGKMGYSLNQKGLFAGVVRNPSNRTEKINAGNIIAGETEEEIFKILGVPFRLPHERAGKEVSVYRQ